MSRLHPMPADRPVVGDTVNHHLFGLRATAPRAGAITGALARLDRLHHDLPDLDMNERDWARLFAGSYG